MARMIGRSRITYSTQKDTANLSIGRWLHGSSNSSGHQSRSSHLTSEESRDHRIVTSDLRGVTGSSEYVPLAEVSQVCCRSRGRANKRLPIGETAHPTNRRSTAATGKNLRQKQIEKVANQNILILQLKL